MENMQSARSWRGRSPVGTEEGSKSNDEDDQLRKFADGGRKGSSPSSSDALSPTERFLTGLRRRNNLRWRKARQVDPTFNVPQDLIDAVAEILPTNVVPQIEVSIGVDNSLDNPVLIPTPTVPDGTGDNGDQGDDNPVITPPPVVESDTVVPTPINTETPEPAAPEDVVSQEFPVPTQAYSTLVSTISNFTPNGTFGNELTRSPITTGTVVIIFTTPTTSTETGKSMATLTGSAVQTTITSLRMVTKNTTFFSLSTTKSTSLYDTTYTEVEAPFFTGDPIVPPAHDQPQPPPPPPPIPSNAPDNDNAPEPVPREQLVGGIVGGIAGIALILWAMIMLLRRHRRARAMQALDDAGYGGPLPSAPTQSMVQRSMSFIGASGLLSRSSRTPTASSVAAGTTGADQEPAERGFVRVAGRKLPPAIAGGMTRADTPTRPEFGSVRSNVPSSYYAGDESAISESTPHSSQGRKAGATRLSAAPSNPFASPPSSPPRPSRLRDSDGPLSGPSVVVNEASPFMAPQDHHSNALPPPIPLPRPLYHRQVSLTTGKDGVGRSLVSQDGSRGSRFTEDI